MMKIRKATLNDLDFTLSLFNDPVTRKNAFNSKTIEKDEYSQWFKKALCSDNIKIYIAMIDKNLVGVGKCQIEHTVGGSMLSWVIHPEKRGMGHGKQMMNQIMENKEGCFYAYIKKSNIASQRIAESIGMKFICIRGDFRYYEFSKRG